MTHPSKACNLDGSLVLPQNFGAIQLGETFSCYISLGNISSKAVSNISIRVELQTERQRRNIFENTSKPLETLAPGQRYDFIIQHDVKELGTHTLACSTVYSDGTKQGQAASQIQGQVPVGGAGGGGSSAAASQVERKYLPQWYKFKVTNPLVVRMKMRTVNNQLHQRTFVEASLENATSDPLLLDVVRFDQTKDYKLLDMNAGPSSSSRGKVVLDDPSKTKDYLKEVVVLKPKGGSYNFIFGLEKCISSASKGSGESESPQQKQQEKGNASSSSLGKLEIKWCKPMGDSGRLQTQWIQGVAPQNKKSLIEVQVIHLEKRVDTMSGASGSSSRDIHLHSCFSVRMTVKNLTNRSMFGVFVVLGVTGVMRNVGPSGMYFKEIPSSVPGSSGSNGGGLILEQMKHVEITFDLIALQVGVHKLGSVLLYDERGKQITETPCNFSVEIVPQPQKDAKAAIPRTETLTTPRSDTLESSEFDSLINL